MNLWGDKNSTYMSMSNHIIIDNIDNNVEVNNCGIDAIDIHIDFHDHDINDVDAGAKSIDIASCKTCNFSCIDK